MALPTPTIKEIQTNIISDIETELGQTIPPLKKAVFRIMALIFAGVWIILYKFGTDAFNQRFVQKANEFFLELSGKLIGVIRQPATTWEGEGTVESTTATGTLPPSTQLVNNNTGIVYLTKEEVILALGTLTLKVRSATGGALGDLQIGDEINFVEAPIPGLTDICTITLTTVDGEDKEELETYRQRVLDGYQKKPQGGAAADYEQWAEEAPNVINAYPYTNDLIAGQVTTFIEVDNQPDGIPTQAQLDVALSYIQFDPITGFATRRPVTAETFTAAISRRTFDTEIVGLSPDTPEIRDDIETAIIELLLRKEPFILGLSITRNDTISQPELQATVQIVASAAGSTISGVNARENGVSFNTAVLGKGEKAKSGVVSYV